MSLRRFIGPLIIGVSGTVVLAYVGTIDLIFMVFIYSIIAMVILSWVAPGGHPISGLLRSITSPVLNPVQRFVPPISGFDLSPLFALILLQLGRIVIVQPLLGLG